MKSAAGATRVGILPPVRSLLARPIETVVPTRLGRSFRWLLSATIINNVGDGIVLAAGPLLVASLTKRSVPGVAGGPERVPPGPALRRPRRRRGGSLQPSPDGHRGQPRSGRRAGRPRRHDRQRDGRASAIVLVTLFVLGTAETFADSASSTLLPGMVAREDLGIANARQQGAFLLTNQLVAPPIGAFLFAAGIGDPVRDERGLLRARGACSSRAS